MKKVGLVALMALLPLAGFAQEAMTADQLIAKNVEARGGIAKLKSVQSMRSTIKMAAGPMEIPMVLEAKRPNKFRMDITFQGQSMVQAYDGKTGWGINPMAGYGGKGGAEPMTPDQLIQAEQQSDMDGPLVDYKSKGHTVEYVGKETVEGSDAYKLKVTLKSSNVQYIFLDSETYLEIKATQKTKVRDTEVDAETFFGDFKEVDGLVFAHSIESGAAGIPMRQKMTIEKVELNPAIDDTRFVMPPKPVEAPVETPAPTPPAPEK